jgi:hypothetical protein
MTGIKEALAECDSTSSGDKIPGQKIADKHGVLRSTLTRRYRRETRSREEVSTSQRNLQPQQEAELVKYIEQLTERKLPSTREMVQDFASDIAGHPVSESWVTRFLHRHEDELTSQWSTSMDRQRHAADSGDKYKVYFGQLGSKIDFYEVEPEHTYNMDEKGFMIGAVGRQKRIFSKRLFKKKQFKQMLQDGNREWISLLACVCADGTALPPALIYAADSKNVQSTWVEDVKVGEHMAFFGVSGSGWSNDGLGLAWLQQVFERFTTAKARRKYRLLLVDGHGSHLTEEFLEYCHRHKILLGIYPPHSTHTLQPLDVVMFKPLSTSYSKKLATRLHKHQGLVPVAKADFFNLFWDAWVSSFTAKNIFSSFKATGVYPFNPDVILDRFTTNDSDTSSNASEETPTYGGEAWQELNTVMKRALSGASEKDVSIVRQSLHHMAIQNTLLQSENEGLLDALTVKRRREAKGKSLDLLQHYEYWGPAMMWTPRSFREAKTRMRLARERREAEEKEKADKKELAKANKLYNEKVARQKRDARAREKEERDRLKAKKAKEVAERKAERERQRQARDSQKAIQKPSTGKRKAAQKAAPRKKQKRSAGDDVGSASRTARTPTPPHQTNSRGRRILRPRKYW